MGNAVLVQLNALQIKYLSTQPNPNLIYMLLFLTGDIGYLIRQTAFQKTLNASNPPQLKINLLALSDCSVYSSLLSVN